MNTRMWVVLAALAAGCGPSAGASSRAVGAQCTSDQDCNNRCITSDDHFQGGMCTTSCASDDDCASGAACIARDGNICAVSCTSDTDCQDFGRGWVCRDEKHLSGGDINVCRLP